MLCLYSYRTEGPEKEVTKFYQADTEDVKKLLKYLPNLVWLSVHLEDGRNYLYHRGCGWSKIDPLINYKDKILSILNVNKQQCLFDEDV